MSMNTIKRKKMWENLNSVCTINNAMQHRKYAIFDVKDIKVLFKID